MSKNLNYLGFILISALWGGSYTGIKVMVNITPPLFSAMLRLILASFFLFLLFKLTRQSTQVPWAMRWKVWLVGLFPLGIPFAFLFWAERFISPGLAGILCATLPIWAFILSLIFLRQYTVVSVQKILGLLIGLAGVCLIFWPMVAFHNNHDEILGSLAAIMMAISYGAGAILNQHILSSTKISFQANIYHQLLSSTVFLILMSLLFEKWPSAHLVFHTPRLWIAVVYLGVFSTALAWLMYYHLIRVWGGVRASAAAYVAPIMAVFWDYVFFHHPPRPSEMIGVIIILAGVVLIQFSREKPKVEKIVLDTV